MKFQVKTTRWRKLLCLWMTALIHGHAGSTWVEVSNTLRWPDCSELSVSARTENFAGILSQKNESRPNSKTQGAYQNAGGTTVNNRMMQCQIWAAPFCPTMNITECMLCMFQKEGESYPAEGRGRDNRGLTRVSLIMNHIQSMTSTKGEREANDLCKMVRCRDAMSRSRVVRSNSSAVKEETESLKRQTEIKRSITAAEESRLSSEATQSYGQRNDEDKGLPSAEQRVVHRTAAVHRTSEDIIAGETSFDEMRPDNDSGIQSEPEENAKAQRTDDPRQYLERESTKLQLLPEPELKGDGS